MILRPATDADVAAVSGLEAEVFGIDAWSPAAVREELTGPRRTALVACGPHVVGYVVVLHGEVVDLQRIAVAPSHRRRGLARRLLREAHAAAAPDARMLLEVHTENAPALAFYADQGFVEIDRRRRYYRGGADAVVMERGPRPLEVRELTPDDWRLWREVRLAALSEAPYAFGSTWADWSGPLDTEQRWRDRLAAGLVSLVLLRGDEPVGMVGAVSAGDEDGPVELVSLWVAPGARGQGMGDVAVERVLTWARVHRPGAEVVLSVKSDNRAAAALYARHGFRDAGRSPDDPGERLMRHP